MGDQSAIEWTDATWNCVTGCDQVSPGCAHCYAKTWAARGLGTFRNGRPFEDVRCHEDKLDLPLRWTRPRRIFVNSLSDLFHEAVPDAFIDRVFARMALAPRHTFQMLTKRAARMRDYFDGPHQVRIADAIRAVEDTYDPRYTSEPRPPSFADYHAAVRANRGLVFPLPNVWLGVSVENPPFLKRLDELMATPAAIRFVSLEPLLADVGDLSRWLYRTRERRGLACAMYSGNPEERIVPGLDWLIVGGESGPGARPFDVTWARSIVDQCRAAGRAVFVKQLGAHPVQRLMFGPATFEPDQPVHYEPIPLRDRKGGDMAEWPEDLRVRQFPRVSVPA
jgi:protein gp37